MPLQAAAAGQRHAGGNGLYFEVEVVAEMPMMASMIMTRFRTAPQGIFGGSSGKVGALLLNGKPINPADHWVLKKGHSVVMETARGGGYASNNLDVTTSFSLSSVRMGVAVRGKSFI